MRVMKDKLDTISKSIVDSDRHYYEDIFLKSIESAESKEKLAGLSDIAGMFAECVPEYHLENFKKNWEAYCRERNKSGNHKTTKTKEEIDEIVDDMARRTYLLGGVYDTEFLYNYYKLVTREKVLSRLSWAICSYYFFSIDNGYKRLAKIFSRVLLTGDYSRDDYDTFASLIGGLVSTSMYVGTENKKSWQDFADKDTEGHLWKEINWALLHTANNQGRKASSIPLTSMLIGDQENLLKLINKFLTEHEEAICMAYLLIALEDAGCIECEGFGVFLKSLNTHFATDYAYRNAQVRYSEIRKYPNNLEKKLSSWVKAKRIIDKWTETFKECA